MAKKKKKDMTVREKRVKKTAEVFTPNKLVNEVLDKLPSEVWEEKEDNTFLDPACGNGNFLIHVLWRKIAKGHDPTEALKTVYGVDIMQDNIKECRLRLLKIISIYEEITKKHIEIIFTNIKWLNSVKWGNGSLDYDMSFKPNFNYNGVDRWYKMIKDGALAEVSLPVECDDTPEKLSDIFGMQEFSEENFE